MIKYGLRTNLDQDHRGDFLGSKLLGPAQVLNLNLRVTIGLNDLERPALTVLGD